jgi:hypothetical protein
VIRTFEKPDSKRFVDRTGFKSGRLSVLGYAGRRGGKQSWCCLCVCGCEFVARWDHIRSGATSSCGCRNTEMLSSRKTHGEASRRSPTPEYAAWKSAKQRCTNESVSGYKNYGGRGIRFLLGDYQTFLRRMGRRPSEVHSLDRIDCNGNYEYGNIRWATQSEQANNKTTCRVIVINGVAKNMSQWCVDFGVNFSSAFRRLNAGWCNECTFAIPMRSGRICSHRRVIADA